MAEENSFSIKGVLFEKISRIVPNKKKPDDPPYEFYSIKLEIKTRAGDRIWTELPEFNLNRGVGFDDFEEGDYVEVWFALAGKKISDTWHKTSLTCNLLRHADIDASGRRPQSNKHSSSKEVEEFPVSFEEDDLPF
jgi:hypothetical protein